MDTTNRLIEKQPKYLHPHPAFRSSNRIALHVEHWLRTERFNLSNLKRVRSAVVQPLHGNPRYIIRFQVQGSLMSHATSCGCGYFTYLRLTTSYKVQWLHAHNVGDTPVGLRLTRHKPIATRHKLGRYYERETCFFHENGSHPWWDSLCSGAVGFLVPWILKFLAACSKQSFYRIIYLCFYFSTARMSSASL
jgi:hypothetical protein